MFFTQQSADQFGAGDRSPYGDFWFKPIGFGLDGRSVSKNDAMRLSAVYRAVSLVSGHMGFLPIRFFKRGTFEPILNHPIERLLNRQPNRFQNAFEWREMLQGHIELRGNCFNEIISDRRGNITDLLPRHPDKVRPIILPDGSDYYYQHTDAGETRKISRQNMWHIRGLSDNGIMGLSVLDYAQQAVQLGLSAQQYGVRFYQNDGRPTSGWVEFPGKYKDSAQRKMVRDSLQEAQSGANAGKLLMLDQGMKYHQVGITNDNAQFLETRQYQVTDIARFFGIPASKLGDLSRATFANIESEQRSYIDDALIVRAARWEAAIECYLLFADEEIDVEFDFEELLRGDGKSRADADHLRIQNGIMTRNEVRRRERLPPLDGLDKPLFPLNMGVVGEEKKD